MLPHWIRVSESAFQGPSGESRTTATQAYYMRIADAVRQKASCDKRLVGAVVVLGNRIVSTGYNGTPEGMTNCNQGGCYRCAHAELYEPGKGYDVCICVKGTESSDRAQAASSYS